MLLRLLDTIEEELDSEAVYLRRVGAYRRKRHACVRGAGTVVYADYRDVLRYADSAPLKGVDSSERHLVISRKERRRLLIERHIIFRRLGAYLRKALSADIDELLISVKSEPCGAGVEICELDFRILLTDEAYFPVSERNKILQRLEYAKFKIALYSVAPIVQIPRRQPDHRNFKRKRIGNIRKRDNSLGELFISELIDYSTEALGVEAADMYIRLDSKPPEFGNQTADRLRIKYADDFGDDYCYAGRGMIPPVFRSDDSVLLCYHAYAVHSFLADLRASRQRL